MDLAKYIPKEIDIHKISKSDFPRMAKDRDLISKIRSAIKGIPTNQRLILSDSRKMEVDDESVGLILSSPPY